MLPKTKFYRLLEITPGALVWATIFGAIILSFVKPLWALLFIIIFDLYWLFRVLYFVFYLTLSWSRFRQAAKIDWHTKLAADYPDSGRIRHLIFLPTYKEELAVLRTTFRALANARCAKEKLIVVLAGEKREGNGFLEKAKALQAEFDHIFADFLITVHPQGLPDEIPGKGSNLHFAGRRVKEYLEAQDIPDDDILVSALDSDTVVHPQYFDYLTHTFLSSADPYRASYQPIALYNNNMWEAPALVRLAALGTTFWLMTELPRPERLFTFSSHSMSWKALTEIGFWEKDIVTEDSRIFLQGFIHFEGRYRVIPLYLPVSMDTVMAGGYRKSLRALYLQQRRWAWGIEHFPYMVWHFFKGKGRRIPLRKKIKFIWNLGEGMYSWATAPLLIFLLGQLPFRFGEDLASGTVLFQMGPHILKWLMRAAMIGVVASAILTSFLLPFSRGRRAIFQKLHFLWHWLLLPFMLIAFGSIPAIDAQTRLMFGKYLGFNVTEKKRKRAGVEPLVNKQAVI